MPDYSLGKVYKIVCNITNEIYVGSTSEPTLARRLSGHVSNCKYYNSSKKGNYISSFPIITRGNYKIILLENCPCNNKDELRMKEQEWCDKIDCVNKAKAFVAQEDGKIYDQFYYTKNKEKILERVAIYKKNHRKRYNELNKLYRERHSDSKTTCECGSSFLYNNNRHLKTKKHLKFLKANPSIKDCDNNNNNV